MKHHKILILLVLFLSTVYSQTEIDSIAIIAYSDTTFNSTFEDSINVEVRLFNYLEESNYAIRKIEFIDNNKNKFIQTIIDTAETRMAFFEAKFVDLTLDGNLDIIITDDFGHTIEVYKTYIYDPKNRKYFLCCTENNLKGYISIDSLNKKIISEFSWAYSYSGGAEKKYFIIKDGSLIFDSSYSDTFKWNEETEKWE